jgi:lipopolysaccharide biosynthesis regulator YciM
LERGLYYDPDVVELNFMLGVSHLSLGHYTEALRYLGRVTKINPKYESNLPLLISIAYNKMGNLQAAVAVINGVDTIAQSQ